MQKKLQLAMFALCYSSLALAQNNNNSQQQAKALDENAFTFTEAQLGEDDNMSQNVTILNSNTNAYASEVGFFFHQSAFVIAHLIKSITTFISMVHQLTT